MYNRQTVDVPPTSDLLTLAYFALDASCLAQTPCSFTHTIKREFYFQTFLFYTFDLKLNDFKFKVKQTSIALHAS